MWFVVELDGGLGCIEFIVDTLLISWGALSDYSLCDDASSHLKTDLYGLLIL